MYLLLYFSENRVCKKVVSGSTPKMCEKRGEPRRTVLQWM